MPAIPPPVRVVESCEMEGPTGVATAGGGKEEEEEEEEEEEVEVVMICNTVAGLVTVEVRVWIASRGLVEREAVVAEGTVLLG